MFFFVEIIWMNLYYTNENKILMLMKIFLLWLGLLCCSISCGIIYDCVPESSRIQYLMIPVCVAAVLLICHVIFTWNRKKPETPSDPQYQSIFTISSGVSFFFSIIGLLSVKTGDVSVGVAVCFVSAFIFFFIAFLREQRYCRIF